MTEIKPALGMLRTGGGPGNRAVAMAYAAHHLGMELYFFSINDVNISTKTIQAQKLVQNRWITEVIPYPLVIDNDNTLSMNNKEVFADLEKHAYLTVQVFGGKLKTLNLLAQHPSTSQYIIPQLVVKNKEEFIEFVNTHRYIVLKPVKGSQGRNIYFIHIKNDEIHLNFEGKNTILNSLEEFYEGTIRGKNFILQKYIESTSLQGAPFDIRVHIQRDEHNQWHNTKTYVRVGTSTGMTANIATGGGIANAVAFIKNTYHELAEQILQTLNRLTSDFPIVFQSFYKKEIDALGIDLGIDKKGNLWIFEVNSFPGTKFFELDEAIIRMGYLKFLYEREHKMQLDLSRFLTKHQLWEANLMVDQQLSQKKPNIGILLSTHSKVGISKAFVEKNKQQIPYLISDSHPDTADLANSMMLVLQDKESELMNVCLEKRNQVDRLVYTIIGSVGKTSVLSLLSQSLRKIQPATYVNDFGNTPFYIAKGIFFAPLKSKHWVFEVAGASYFREEPISVHTHRMLQPNVCIFTNIAEAHVGNIGSLKEIAILKAKALSVLAPNSIVLLNHNMPYQEIIHSYIPDSVKVYTYGDQITSDFRALNSAEDILKFSYQNEEYQIPITPHLAPEIKLNFLAVTAALLLTQENWQMGCSHFANWQPIQGRGNLEIKKIQDKTISIINDAYNANPVSLKIALSNLIDRQHQGRKVAVLGEISELGDHNERIHKDILDFVHGLDLDRIVLVGPSYVQHASDYVQHKKYLFLNHVSELKSDFEKIISDNDLILFKGSNSTKLFDFLKKI